MNKAYTRTCGHISTEFRAAAIRPGGSLLKGYEVMRTKEDGSFDWFTTHFTYRGAKKAVDTYAETGKVIGVKS